MQLGATFTKEEQVIHDVLVDYDKARKAEGFAVAYRRWARYAHIGDGHSGSMWGEHVETMYLNKANGKALLVKVQPDGAVSAFESIA